LFDSFGDSTLYIILTAVG